MKVTELEKRWRDNYSGTQEQEFDIVINLELYKEGDRYFVFLADASSSGYKMSVSNTEEIGNAVKNYLEEQF